MKYTDSPEISVELQSLRHRFNRMRKIIEDANTLKQYEEYIPEIFDDKTELGTSNRERFRNALIKEEREPLQGLVKTYQSKFVQAVRERSATARHGELT